MISGRRIGLVLLVASLIVVVLLVFVPGPVDSQAWTPPPAPKLEGVMAPNDELTRAELVVSDDIFGPEDIAVDGAGTMYAGMQDGRIVRLTMAGEITTLVNTGGRPLGLDWHPDGRLIVADAFRGLLAVSVDGAVTVLSQGADGVPFGFADDVDVASNGRIYFSDASSKFNQHEYRLDLLETRPYGRLLEYDPDTETTRVLMDGLYFANGVALSQAEDFVLVNETWRYRVTRYWLTGPKAGTSDIFIDNLPGFPDGISANGRGTFWLALPSPRKADVDALHPKPWLKNLVAKLPEALQPAATRYGLVASLNEAGEITGSSHDPSGQHVWEVTSVEEHNGYVYLGSLTTDRVARLPVP